MATISSEPKERNRQLLDIIGKKLSKTQSFVEAANKLAKWTNDPRAYYDDVRERIIKLLERARLTLRHELNLAPGAPFNIHHYPDNPFISAYKNLILTVYKYRSSFPRDELHLQSRLQGLYMTVTSLDNIIDLDAMSSPGSTVAAQTAVPQSSPPVAASPTVSLPITVMSPITESTPTTISFPNLHTSNLSTTNPTSASISSPVSAAIITPADSKPNTNPPLSTTPSPPNLPQKRQRDDPEPATAKPRKKKKRKLNLSEMLDLDQEDQVASTSGPSFSSALKKEDTPVIVEDSSHSTTDTLAASPSAETMMPSTHIQGGSTLQSNSVSSSHPDKERGSPSPNPKVPVPPTPASTLDPPRNSTSPSTLTIEPTHDSLGVIEQLPTPVTADIQNSGEVPLAVPTDVETVDRAEHSTDDTMDVDAQPNEQISEDAMDTTDDTQRAASVTSGMLFTPDKSLSDAKEVQRGVETANDVCVDEVPIPKSPAIPSVAFNETGPVDAPSKTNSEASTITPVNSTPPVEPPSVETRSYRVSLPKSPGLGKTAITRRQNGLKKTAQTTMRFAVDSAQFASVERWNNRRNSPTREGHSLLFPRMLPSD
ncbi:hypothetical protein C8R42DRAFT_279310 [Lentinula raphanica]|nr:hypothetical protein C8R42DRAFT_279310 [Lentinula raphanica]